MRDGDDSPVSRERFVRRYAGLVHWAARKTLRENHAQADLLEDVFQSVFQKLLEPGVVRRLREPEAIKSWIVVVTCRTALSALRSDSRRRRREKPIDTLADGEEHASFPGARPSGPNEDLLDEERRRVIAELVGRLSPRERACIRLYYEEGLLHARIGEVLGFPEATVASVLRRARESLREGLRRHGYEKS